MTAPSLYLGGINPFSAKIVPLMSNPAGISHQVNDHELTSYCFSGGGEGSFFVVSEPLRLHISAITRRMDREYQEDSLYVATITGPDINCAVLSVADGVGGHIAGDLASSAFIFGVHAALVDVLQNGETVGVGQLFQGGVLALERQRYEFQVMRGGADTTGIVAVVSDDSTDIAWKGDSMFAHFLSGKTRHTDLHLDRSGGRDYLVRHAGTEETPEVETWDALVPGAVLIGGSDGFFGQVYDGDFGGELSRATLIGVEKSDAFDRLVALSEEFSGDPNAALQIHPKAYDVEPSHQIFPQSIGKKDNSTLIVAKRF